MKFSPITISLICRNFWCADGARWSKSNALPAKYITCTHHLFAKHCLILVSSPKNGQKRKIEGESTGVKKWRSGKATEREVKRNRYDYDEVIILQQPTQESQIIIRRLLRHKLQHHTKKRKQKKRKWKKYYIFYMRYESVIYYSIHVWYIQCTHSTFVQQYITLAIIWLGGYT